MPSRCQPGIRHGAVQPRGSGTRVGRAHSPPPKKKTDDQHPAHLSTSKSDGLTDELATRTSTSPSPGLGVLTVSIVTQAKSGALSMVEKGWGKGGCEAASELVTGWLAGWGWASDYTATEYGKGRRLDQEAKNGCRDVQKTKIDGRGEVVTRSLWSC